MCSDEKDLRDVSTTEDINEIYAKIKEECSDLQESHVLNVQSPYLKVDLYPFQIETVRWMISMEEAKNIMGSYHNYIVS